MKSHKDQLALEDKEKKSASCGFQNWYVLIMTNAHQKACCSFSALLLNSQSSYVI